MDRRLPPSFRMGNAEPSPSRERPVSSINRSHNRPWGSGGVMETSPSRAGYSTLRSSSPSSGSSFRSESPSGGAPRSSSSFSAGGVDTTTTIDGIKGSLSGGLSSYERYRSLREQAGSTASSTLSEVETRAASLLSTALPPPSSSLAQQQPIAASRGRLPTLSPAGSSLRSSSPRDLRKQRLQQQFASSSPRGNSPYRGQQQYQQQQITEATMSSLQWQGSLAQQRQRQHQPTPSLPRQQLQTTSKQRNDDWLACIRSATATSSQTVERNTASEETETKDRDKKHKKSSSRSKSDGDEADFENADSSKRPSVKRSSSQTLDTMTKAAFDGDENVGDSKKQSAHRRSPGIDGDLDDSTFKDSPTKASPRKSKKTHKVNRHKSKKSSSSIISGSSDDASDEINDELNTQNQAERSERSTARLSSVSLEEPSIQTALDKLGKAVPRGLRSSSIVHSSDEMTASRLAALQQQSSLAPSMSVPRPLATSQGGGGGSKSLTDFSAAAAPLSSLPPTSSTNSTTRGWSTYRSSRPANPFMSSKSIVGDSIGSGSGTNKVSQYLNQRKNVTANPPSGLLDKNSGHGLKALGGASGALTSGTSGDAGTALLPGTASGEGVFGNSETTDEESEETSASSSSDEELDGDADSSPDWSVRVCVISAIDLPPSVVPTVPFSPVLKVGLVSLKGGSDLDDGEPSTSTTKANEGRNMDEVAQANLKRTLHVSGLTSVSKARIRSTTAKVMSKRDNGSIEFHEEMRWDATESPEQMAFAIELSARAVMVPSNHKESPFEPGAGLETSRAGKEGSAGSVTSTSTDSSGRLGSLFRRGVKKHPSSEMDMALAASAVAKHLVEDGGDGNDGDDNDSKASSQARSLCSGAPGGTSAGSHTTSEIGVKLINKKPRKRKPRMTDDMRLGSQIIPLSKLSWHKALKNNEAARIEQWFELETAAGGSPGAKFGAKSTRNPSVLLEISFSSPEVLDDSEDDLEEEDDDKRMRDPKKNASFSRRASITIRSQLRKEVQMEEVKKQEEEPVLEPGIIDYICVVGALNIGDQKKDTGASGWVNATPESGVLEQFPPSPEYHAKYGRNVVLPDKMDWFCFPEGLKLWRGTTPPNSDELNLVRFSASSPANIATTIALFDAYLGCTTSFSWFVLSSNSDEYGSANMKMYGACIRFFVPAPTGIDPTQDDFGQDIRGAALNDKASKRLWVPLALCMTSQIPIVGSMELMLLRMCEALSSMVGLQGQSAGIRRFLEDVFGVVINYQRPIPGVVSCSFPFLNGDPITLTLPPPSSLPCLPHGASVTSACRLLGANGINYLLAAMLTECKILVHSDDTANLCLVGEVMSALMYPFQWSLPYIPVLPMSMMEFIEAPLSYFLGMPSSSMKLVNPEYLEDVVVIDLDMDFAGAAGHVEDFGGRTIHPGSKTPTPLPASTAMNIQKAVYRLIQHNDDNEGDGGFPSTARTFPRSAPESQNEREFRIAVALEVAGLVRGYQDCLVIGPGNQPMFNVDKFLQSAPILFDEQRGTSVGAQAGLRILSPRSRRFVSILVTCQHFHQFLEVSESGSLSFFREVMMELEAYGNKRDVLAVKRVLSLDAQKTIDQLHSILKRADDKIPLYKVNKSKSELKLPDDPHAVALSATRDFPYSLLQPIVVGGGKESQGEMKKAGVHKISLEHLVQLEKNPWRYQAFLGTDLSKESGFVPVSEKVKLRDAIGERRYLQWKSASERGDDEDASVVSEDTAANHALDWTQLLAENGEEQSVHSESGLAEADPAEAAKRKIADAKDRDVLRRCLEQARVSGNAALDPSSDVGRDLVSEAESALRNVSARRFLLSILEKRGSSESAETTRSRRRSTGASKLETGAFEVLLRLGCAMLDVCIEDRDYDAAYALLKMTAGLYSTVENGESSTILYMTERLGHHPIFADLGVWLRAKKMHLNAGAENENHERTAEDSETDKYEAAVATLYEMLGYGIPAEELARFASRVSEENGWFRSERGQSLLLLARRICMRRDTGSSGASHKTTSDIEMMSAAPTNRDPSASDVADSGRGSPVHKKHEPGIDELTWSEIGWVHPSAQYSSRFEKDVKRRPHNSKDEGRTRHMKRSAVTSMAYLGSSIVVTGGLDGGVFMARSTLQSNQEGVKGIHLDWGSAGTRYTVQSASAATDGAYGVGSVSVLAATQPANHSYEVLQMKPGPSRKSVTDVLAEEELLGAMEGCRIVAGTTCGDLRVWSVKDVLSAVFFAMRGNDSGSTGEDRITHRGGECATSSVIGGRRRGGVDFTAGSSLTRLKFSLRGRALSGHRGGVSCVDVPSHVYRPDSIITGGADGLIKLWSLRTPGSGSRKGDSESVALSAATEQLSSNAKAVRSGDAMSILSGHGGRILCVKTAWHGDRLLSGGADRTVRLWDLAGSGGKCLNSLSGHFGWVTSVKYWGPNTIISASTDRSIALWDARVRNSPLFTLRHHYAPISDILVGARTDPIMISAGGDGTIAAWDFRRLSDASSQSQSSQNRQCKVIRRPAGKLYLHDFSSRRRTYGPVLLTRGPSQTSRTVSCLGRDAIIREWDIGSGEVISEQITGHCDTISTFSALEGNKLHDTQLENSNSRFITGTITTSWDGTIRLRQLQNQHQSSAQP